MDGLPEVVPLRRWGQMVGADAVFAFLATVGWVIGSSQEIRWGEIPAYLFNPAILAGVLMTIELTVAAMVIGTGLGIALAAMQMSANPVLRWVARGYVWFFRGTPLLVQIIFWFNIALFVPVVHLGPWSWDTNVLISAGTAGLLALSLHEAANMAEIIRSGMLSVESGQTDAAQALGLTRLQALRRIILPQATRIIIPPTGNQAIGMLKGTAMVSVIGMHDLLTQAQNTYARNFLVIELLIVASIWYLVMTTVASFGQHFLELHLQRSTAAGSGLGLAKRIRRNLLPKALQPS